MADFIVNNKFNIITVICILITLCIAYKFGHKDTVKKIILSLVIRAEKYLGSGTGELKYAYVIDEVYKRLPTLLKVLYTKSEIDEFIEDGVKKLKKVLTENKSNLHGYDEETYISSIEQLDKDELH